MKRLPRMFVAALVLLSSLGGASAATFVGHQPGGKLSVDGNLAQLRARADQTPPTLAPWTDEGPESTDYNKETAVEGWPWSVETTLAILYCFMLASTPLLLAALADRQLTRAHMLESVALIAWLGSVLFLFTSVLKFQSTFGHFEGHRPLTLVEACYLLSQIVTTVGYGDITPAFPRGMVWVGFNVILSLCLYGSIIAEVVGMAWERARSVLNLGKAARQEGQPLRNWSAELEVNGRYLADSAASFALLSSVGVLFWHYWPGEEKTWLQSVYFSVITLSTVGFGDYGAMTEAGKVFAAFWMLFGVASLGALVSSFIETMLHQKHVERRRNTDISRELQDMVNQVTTVEGRMDKTQFLKFGLILTKGVDPLAFRKIDKRFRHLVEKQQGGGDGQMLRRTVLVDAEGPHL